MILVVRAADCESRRIVACLGEKAVRPVRAGRRADGANPGTKDGTYVVVHLPISSPKRLL